MNVKSKDEFESLITDNELVMVDFWAPWCGPCKMVGPIMDELINDDLGDVVVSKANVDEMDGSLSMEYKIRSIPTVLLFKGGKEVERITGVRPKSFYLEKINENK